jgi:DNA-binding transcriptional LysR family regulator
MELMQLEMFIAVVEERSVRKAAERVYRTQPAISIALRNLEQEIGTRLLDRSRHMDDRPTQVGQILYEYASRMLGLRNEVLSVLQKRTQHRLGFERVHLTPSARPQAEEKTAILT